MAFWSHENPIAASLRARDKKKVVVVRLELAEAMGPSSFLQNFTCAMVSELKHKNIPT
jgi:hypothetical protein